MKEKTMFAIYLMEDEEGFVTVQADHYGPGMSSYILGIQILNDLRRVELSNPGSVEVQSFNFLARPQ